MKPRPEYETLTSALMGRMPLPSLDVCRNELHRKEQCLLTKTNLVQQKPKKYTVAYSARGAPQTYQNPQTPQIDQVTQTSQVIQNRDMSKVQCYSCKKFGHIAK